MGSSFRHHQQSRSSNLRWLDGEDEDDRHDDDDDDEKDDDSNGRYHPDKGDVDCAEYWRRRNNQTRSLGGQNNDDDDDEDEDNTDDWLRYQPCRDRPPPQTFGNGQPPNGGNGGGQQQQQQQQPPPPPPMMPLNNTDNNGIVIPDNAIVINVSLAIPIQYRKGIPIRVTNVMKQYLNSTNVTLEFFALEYTDGRHFAIEFARPKPFSSLINGGDGDEDDIGTTNNPEQVSGGGTGSVNNGGSNNNNAATSSENDNDFRRRQRQRRHLGPSWEYDQVEGANGPPGNPPRSWDVTDLPPVEHASLLSLVPVSSFEAELVDQEGQTMEGSLFAWFNHKVYLMAHTGPLNLDPNNTNNDTSPVDVRDMELMAWLQKELQGIVNDDINLQGPLGPYYDDNNYYAHHNNASRQISFLEWSFQEQGIPIADVAIPGNEHWHSLPHYYPPPVVAPPTGMPGGTSGAPYVAPTDSIDLEMEVYKETGDGSYQTPLSTNESARQWLGLTCLLCTVVFSFTLAFVANEVGKRREQDELWGNVMFLENEDGEDVSYLDVGWRFAIADGNQFHSNNNNATAAPAVPDQVMLMELFDKKGVGYKDGDSLLMGGFEYKSARASDATSQTNNHNVLRGHRY